MAMRAGCTTPFHGANKNLAILLAILTGEFVKGHAYIEKYPTSTRNKKFTIIIYENPIQSPHLHRISNGSVGDFHNPLPSR